MKTCFKCGTVKALADFYAHAQMADGRLNKCITCTKIDVAKRAKKLSLTDADWVAKERERSRRKQADARARGVAHPTTQEIRDRWAERNAHKVAAHSVMSTAIKSGRIVRAKSCQKCGAKGRIEGHHEDYSKPLEIVWLCVSCHGMTRRKPAPTYQEVSLL